MGAARSTVGPVPASPAAPNSRVVLLGRKKGRESETDSLGEGRGEIDIRKMD